MPFGDLPRKPNIVLIVTDQEREPMHWPEGWADANLPSRRRLLDNGLQFTRARCNTAACSSSRATMMTGLYPAQHGVKNLVTADDPKDKVQRHLSVLPSRLPNLATVMADAGYYSVLKGKFHLTRPVEFNHEMKRPYWSDADIAHLEERYGFHGWNPPDMSDPQSLGDLGGGAINNDGRFVDGSGTAAGETRPHGELYRQSAVHFLNSYDGDKPFFLVVCLTNPHDVQEYPGRGIHGVGINPTFDKGGYRLEDFENLPIDLPPNLEDDLSTKPSVHASMRQLLGIWGGHVRTRTRQLNYARFYAYLIQQADLQIMKLLAALDANGLTDDTVVIRTSDHGELGLSHGYLRQKFYNAYEETLSIPLIVSNPRLYPEPVGTDSFAGLVDLLPTLASIGGAPEPERYGSKGRDLSPILGNPSADVQDVHHFTYEDDEFPVKGAGFIRAVVEEGWKYAVYYDPFTGASPEYELYDLANDPLELTNLAHPTHATEASEAERERLHARLRDVMRERGTAPDEIRWPEFSDYRPLQRVAATGDVAAVVA
ncbi:MAG TPA: sulfatase-like hydrolase/transferase [Gaiellaceae bacterium]|nr:sulfatase-like hydrolase/transferase [Gaiellaceae bacterium]